MFCGNKVGSRPKFPPPELQASGVPTKRSCSVYPPGRGYPRAPSAGRGEPVRRRVAGHGHCPFKEPFRPAVFRKLIRKGLGSHENVGEPDSCRGFSIRTW